MACRMWNPSKINVLQSNESIKYGKKYEKSNTEKFWIIERKKNKQTNKIANIIQCSITKKCNYYKTVW